MPLNTLRNVADRMSGKATSFFSLYGFNWVSDAWRHWLRQDPAAGASNGAPNFTTGQEAPP